MDRNITIEYEKDFKHFQTPEVNYLFNPKTGFMATWGKTQQEDPDWSPYGPFIADIEITTKCTGIKGHLCKYCYKANTPAGENMSFETFQNVLNNINQNKQLTQIAFGLGSTATENPDLWKMCEYARSQEVIPNGTVADVTQETANKIAKYFGACAVSMHLLENPQGREACYDTVERLVRAGCKQVNIHYVLCEETYEGVWKTFEDMAKEPRLRGLRALVFLSMKAQGRAKTSNLTPLSRERFGDIVKKALKWNMNIGFDSCTAPKFEAVIDDMQQKSEMTLKTAKKIVQLSERCESGCFSIYINTDGKIYPCSFLEKGDGIDVVKYREDFCKEVWNGELLPWREKLLKNNRCCPEYDI